MFQISFRGYAPGTYIPYFINFGENQKSNLKSPIQLDLTFSGKPKRGIHTQSLAVTTTALERRTTWEAVNLNGSRRKQLYTYFVWSYVHKRTYKGKNHENVIVNVLFSMLFLAVRLASLFISLFVSPAVRMPVSFSSCRFVRAAVFCMFLSSTYTCVLEAFLVSLRQNM